MNGLNWDKRYVKHYVRRDGWLPAGLEYRKRTGNKSVKYLTLCDEQAIDIFMLERAGILNRDSNGKLPNVIICEKDESKLTAINAIVKPPLQEFIINESLEDLLTYRERPHGLSIVDNRFDTIRSKEERKKVRLERRHEQFKMYLPFDIINFDPSNSILERNLNSNRLYDALGCIFELQKLTNNFLLFVTTKISGTDPSITNLFAKDLRENLIKYPQFNAAMIAKFGISEFVKLPDPHRSSICFLKSIIVKMAMHSGWAIESHGSYAYENYDGSKWLSSVMFCKQSIVSDNESPYINDIIALIETKMKNYSYDSSLKDQPLKEDLRKIVEYRESIRNS